MSTREEFDKLLLSLDYREVLRPEDQAVFVDFVAELDAEIQALKELVTWHEENSNSWAIRYDRLKVRYDALKSRVEGSPKFWAELDDNIMINVTWEEPSPIHAHRYKEVYCVPCEVSDG